MTAAPADLPEAAKAHTAKGAEAFARYFFETASQAEQTADSTGLKRLLLSGGRGCAAFSDIPEALRKAKHHLDRASLSVRETRVKPDASSDKVVVESLLGDSPSKVLDSTGKVVTTDPGDKLDVEMTLEWRDGLWLAADCVLVK